MLSDNKGCGRRRRARRTNGRGNLHVGKSLPKGVSYHPISLERKDSEAEISRRQSQQITRGRGAAARGFGLKYNSKLYETHVMTTLDTQGDMSPQNFIRGDYEGGWKYDTDFDLRVINRNDGLEEPLQISDSCGKPNYKAVYIWKLIMYFPDGTQHEFRPTGYSDTSQSFYGQLQTGDGYFNVDTTGLTNDLSYGSIAGPCPNYQTVLVPGQDPNSHMTYYSTDGTFMRLEIPNGQSTRYPATWTLYMPDGSKVTRGEQGGTLPQRIYDSNGNFVTSSQVTLPDSSIVTGHVDQFGRYVARKVVSPLEDRIIKRGVDGQTVEWIIRWKHITVIKKYTTSTTINGIGRCCYSDQVLVHRPRVIDEIEVPAQLGGQKYIFEYNGHEGHVEWNQSIGSPNSSPGWGDLISVTLPSGAKAEYEFSTTIPFVAFDVDDLMPLLGGVREKRLIYDVSYDGSTHQEIDTWSYSRSSNSAAITGPDGGVTTQSFYSTNTDNELSGRVHRERTPNGIITERIWKRNIIGGCPQYGCGSMRRLNTYVKTEFVTIPDSAGNPILTAIKDYDFDKNGNVTKITEYDWASYNSLPRDSAGKVSGIPGTATIKRITENVFYNPTYDAANENSTADNVNAYWNSSSPRVTSAIDSTTVKADDNTPVSRTEIDYDNPSTTANPVATRVWDSWKGGQYRAYSSPLTPTNSISSTVQYDQYGNPELITDPNNAKTHITYGSIVGPNGTVSGLYPTQTVAAYGTTLARTSAATYDFHTGLALTSTDVDNNVSNETVYDALGRPTVTKSAVGTALESWTQTTYHDGSLSDPRRYVVVRSDLETKGDGKKVATQFFDQLGRVRLAKTLEDAATQDPYNETHGIKVQTRYSTGDPHSYQLTSNPYRADYPSNETDPTMGWTRSKSWNTGRKQEVETFSGPSLPFPWGTNANATGIVTTDIDAGRTLVTDQAGKQRISKTNALGQLKEVWEILAASEPGSESVAFPNTSIAHGFKTTYNYDTLNNLTTVNQGAQQRNFTYSSLSRLLSATNPESGTFSYQYDLNGNLTQKDDARGVRTSYVYDVLNRVTNRNYSTPGGTPSNYQTTPNVAYTYKMTAPGLGNLIKVESSVSTTEYTSFDILGRVTGHRQTTDGKEYETDYTYNLSGALIEQTYPSGRKVKNTFDMNGNLAQVQSQKNATDIWRPYAGNFVYTAAGAVSSMKLGNGKFENTTFNSRLQPTQIGLGSSATNQGLLKLNYNYGTTNNNGNILSQTITVPTVGQTTGFVAIQNYSYDSLNRLKQATENITPNGGSQSLSWQQTYTFDRYGNRNFDEANTTTLPKDCTESGNPVVCEAIRPIVNPSVNTGNNRLNGYTFDPAGNTTVDAEGRQFTYPTENKQVKVKDPQNQTIGEYSYDGDAKRVKKFVPATGEATLFVYDIQGKMVAEYSTQIEQSPKINYVTHDYLGSPRILTDQFGLVVSSRDFMPYGEEITRTSYGQDSVREKFATYERDEETDLYFAQARIYPDTLGRFSSVDPVFESMEMAMPQSMNRYTYVLNNPLFFVDPNGELWMLVKGQQNPQWVDECPTNTTCFAALALENVNRGLNVYGSKNADDVTEYSANKDGQIDVRELSQHHDAQFIVADHQKIPEEFLSVNAAGTLFNVAELYSQTFKDDEKLVMTAGNMANGRPCTNSNGTPCHGGHKGDDIDLRYMGVDGKVLAGENS